MQLALSSDGHAIDYEDSTHTFVTVTDVAECQVRVLDTVMITGKEYAMAVDLYDDKRHLMYITDVSLCQHARMNIAEHADGDLRGRIVLVAH